MRAHDLSGLEPDNFLAFLTLVGLLRALETPEPSWKPRAVWTGVPLRPRLLLDADVDRAALAEAAVRGIARYGTTYAFDADDIKFSAEEFRTLADDVTSVERGELVAALGSDGAMKRDGKAVEATPLCTMLGSGHQHFLRRLFKRNDDANHRGSHRGGIIRALDLRGYDGVVPLGSDRRPTLRVSMGQPVGHRQ